MGIQIHLDARRWFRISSRTFHVLYGKKYTESKIQNMQAVTPVTTEEDENVAAEGNENRHEGSY